MLRKFVGAAIVLFVGASIALADEYTAIIVKDGENYKIYKLVGKGKEAKKEDEATKAKIGKDTQWVSRSFKSKEEAKMTTEQVAEAFSKGKTKDQIVARVTTDDKDNVTKISIFRFGKGPKKDKDKDKE